jgi:Glycosyl hydrolase family 48
MHLPPGRIRLALVAACALAMPLAGCSGGPGQPLFKHGGPLITLRVGVYADPGYQSSGLYAEYERLHPDIKIVRSDTTARASYWPALEVYEYYAAKSGNATAQTAAQNIIDTIHEYYADSLGFSSPETRTDYSNFTSAYNTTNYEAVFNYHRFWAEVDIATAFESFAQLFPTAAPPSGF